MKKLIKSTQEKATLYKKKFNLTSKSKKNETFYFQVNKIQM